MNALRLNFLWICLFLAMVPLFSLLAGDETLPRIYIQSIQPDTKGLQKVSDSATSSLTLGLLEEGGGKYSFLDDASLASLLKQLGTSLQLGSRSPEFYESIASSPYNPDFLVSGELSGDPQNIRLVVRFLEKPIKNAKSYQLKKTLQFTLKEYQLDFYCKEIARVFLRKTYTVRESDAPAFYVPKLTFSEIKISEIEGQSLAVQSLQSDSEGVQSYSVALVQKMDEADKEASAGHWEKAFEHYSKLRKAMETLDPSTKTKIPTVIKRAESGMQKTRKVIFAKKIQEVDIKLKVEEESSRRSSYSAYRKIREEYLELPDYTRAPEISRLVDDRIVQLVLYEESREEALGDKEYSELLFDQSYKRFDQILNRLNELPIKEGAGKKLEDFRIRIADKKSIVSRSALAYVKAKVKGLFEIADTEYSRSLLEREMGNAAVARERRALAVKAMEVALLTFSQTRFSSDELAREYEVLAKKLNSDDGLDFSLQNLVLFVPRYVGNVARGVSDLFVWKVGYGVGAGAEVGFIGTEASLASYPVEIRSGYGAYPSPASKMAGWENQLESEKNSATFGMVYVGVATCSQLYLIRFCDSRDNQTGEDRSTVWKYTSANVHLALGPAIFVSFEGYRLIELGGVFLLQDPNLTGEGRERMKYFRSERVPEKSEKVQYIFTLDDLPKH